MQESTLLRLAERQAGREEELLASKQKVAELEAELGDLQREVELRQEQESALKEARPSRVCNSLMLLMPSLPCPPAPGLNVKSICQAGPVEDRQSALLCLK